jgi:drug/metabolite transporter (DMT)-like permease
LVLAFLTICVVWGSTYFAIRVALQGFAPFAIGALRFLAAGGVLYGFLRARGEPSLTLRQWGAAFATGALFFLVGNGFVNLAERSVSSGLVAVLVATMPLWATVFARLCGEPSSRREWFGLALGLVGVIVLNLGGELRANGAGAVFGLVASISFALGSVLNKRLDLPRGSMATAAQMLSGGALMLVASILGGEHFALAPSLSSVFAVAYLAIFGSLIGFSVYAFLLRETRPAIATSYAYVNPVIAIAIGVAVGGEGLDRASAAGAIIVLVAVLLITRSGVRTKVQAASPPLPAPPPSLRYLTDG